MEGEGPEVRRQAGETGRKAGIPAARNCPRQQLGPVTQDLVQSRTTQKVGVESKGQGKGSKERSKGKLGQRG